MINGNGEAETTNTTTIMTSINHQPPSSTGLEHQTVWPDVSPLIQAACLDLRDGELIHADNFNLFASMSALEIMDPKMDSGIVCKYYSVDKAIDHGAAPSLLVLIKPLTSSVFSIYGPSFIVGGNLAQGSNFGSNCCFTRFFYHVLMKKRIFFTMSYGLPLSGIEDEMCLSILNAVEETISRQLRACKAPSSKKILLEDIEPFIIILI